MTTQDKDVPDVEPVDLFALEITGDETEVVTSPTTGEPYRYGLNFGSRDTGFVAVLSDNVSTLTGFALAILTAPDGIPRDPLQAASHEAVLRYVRIYEELPDLEAYHVRIDAAVQVADNFQRQLLVGALGQGDYLADYPEQDVHAVMLTREKPIRAKAWRHPFPAIVSDHLYPPFGSARLFIENSPNNDHPVIKLQSGDEMAFLESLSVLKIWDFTMSGETVDVFVEGD